MFKLVVVAVILAVCAAHPAPQPLAVSYTDPHLTREITSYPVYPEVHNYRTLGTYPSPVVSYPEYQPSLYGHQAFSASY